jgi:transcriptional regulator with XRE-family HTH domain
MKAIHKNIYALRILRGYSREQMADVLSICARQYANIENGKSKIDTDRLNIIASKLKVHVNTLIGLTDEIDSKGS